MNSSKTSMRLALICLCLLCLCCGSANALDFGGLWKDIKKKVNENKTARNAVDVVKNKAETFTEEDLNKDGQLGKFRSQEKNANDREVLADLNAKLRLSSTLERSTRALSPQAQTEPKAAATPRLRK